VVELNCFILDKIFKTSPSSFKEKAAEGEIINYIQVDSMKVEWLIETSPSFLISPIQIVIYTWWLFSFFGIAFVFGFITLIIFLIINFMIQSKLFQLENDLLAAKDERLKITSETFNCLKVLKLYSWEGEFLKRTIESREKETIITSSYRDYNIFNIFLFSLSPVTVSMVSIGFYQYFMNEEGLNITNMIMGITLFNMLQEPIRSIPVSINCIYEAIVSCNRIGVINNYY